jgi:3-methyladenine DNA glycosylase AlkD
MRSEWVATEIAKSRRRERSEGKPVLFPIRLVDMKTIQEWECFDADIGKDSAREIRDFFIPDFSNWKDLAAFEAAFVGLLSDLRAGAE